MRSFVAVLSVSCLLLLSTVLYGGRGLAPGIAGELQEADVIDPEGQKLGTVKRIEFNVSRGTIAYVVVEPETGDRLVPVPYGSFMLTPDKRLVLDADQARILRAPNYSKDGEPAWSATWQSEIKRFWTTETTWQTAEGSTELSNTP